MKGRFIAAFVLLVCVFAPTNVFGQGGNGALTGTVEDPTKALIPGVTITATNTQTGVITTAITNESGAYNIPGLLPGVYTLSAELSGFRKVTFDNIELGTNETKRFNFTLQVGTVATAVDVKIDATSLLTVSSPTVGEVLPEYKVKELPLVGTDILDLIGVLGGARVSAGGGDNTTFAGISAAYVNTTVNGQSVNDGRYQVGVYSTTRISPDLVGEIRLILTPVDAEFGRGNGQVQIQTRSGTNQFRGTAVDYIRNSALDARSWQEKQTVPLPPRQWLNQHQFSVSYGGPIIKNKTFFYALWDQQITLIKETVNALVLTDCARNGIFRYFPDWNNGNANQALPTAPTTSGNAAFPVVDVAGNPRTPTTRRNGAAYTDTLQYVSVFGRLQTLPTKPDCSDAVVAPGTAWDSNRAAPDQTGFVKKVMGVMPRANNFTAGGDGLNTAIHRWTRRIEGDDGVSGGTDDTTRRKQINLRIDHNFNASHKLSANWSYERDDSIGVAPAYPDGFWGSVERRPHVLSTNFTSTLSPTLVNEARFGVRYNVAKQYEPMDDPTYGKAARQFMPTINGLPVVVGLGSGNVSFQSSVMNFGDFTRGNVSPLWTWADTLSWTKGAHAFKFGGEIRRAKSDGWSNLNMIPRATGGVGQLPLPTFSDSLPGLLTTNNGTIGNLLVFHAASIGNINQLYFLKSPDRLDQFDDIRSSKDRGTDIRQHEWAAFFKDDWKIHRDLTLNLGLRYEYYGSPYEANGLTAVPVGGGLAAFGYSGRSFEDWFRPGKRGENTVFEFVGPNSPNPDRAAWKSDRNNFGPAVGFAWQVPWFGQSRTTVRGGYQITYQGGNRSLDYDIDFGYAPGMIFTPNLAAQTSTYITLADLQKSTACGGVACFPVPHNIKPMGVIPETYRATISGWRSAVYDPDYVAPYIQNFTLSVTRSIGTKFTADVRYIGTRGIKLVSNPGNLPLNSRNFTTNGLKAALDAARYGGESQLLDEMFNGINIAGTGCGVTGSGACGAVGSMVAGVRQTGAMHMRASTQFNSNLANGDYSAIAGTLNTLNYNKAFSGNASLPDIPLNTLGAVLRHNNFPENFISANPQFNTIGLRTNLNNSNYHALQAQFTMRPSRGISYQGTYTWSKFMGSPANGGFQDPADRREYGLQFGHRSHDFRSNGTFELPIGPNKLLLANSSGWLARLVEHWQTSWIFQVTSGRPNTISAAQRLFQGTGTPVIDPNGVAYFGDWPSKFGSVNWPDGAKYGSYFPADTFVRVDDPQCDRVSSLQNLNGLVGATVVGRCTLDALARPLPSGTTGVPGQITLPDGRPGLIVLRNALPGERGNLGLNTMEGVGLWFLDAAISKTIQIGETRNVQFRVDAKNLLNHPTPDDPGFPTCNGLGSNLSLTASSFPFGTIGGKCVAESPARRFQASARINF